MGTDVANRTGLTSAEAAARLEADGPNVVLDLAQLGVALAGCAAIAVTPGVLLRLARHGRA